MKASILPMDLENILISFPKEQAIEVAEYVSKIGKPKRIFSLSELLDQMSVYFFQNRRTSSLS